MAVRIGRLASRIRDTALWPGSPVWENVRFRRCRAGAVNNIAGRRARLRLAPSSRGEPRADTALSRTGPHGTTADDRKTTLNPGVAGCPCAPGPLAWR